MNPDKSPRDLLDEWLARELAWRAQLPIEQRVLIRHDGDHGRSGPNANTLRRLYDAALCIEVAS